MRTHGWFVFGVLKMDHQKEIAGGLSGVFRQLLSQVFFQRDGFNFAVGLRLPTPGSNGKEELFLLIVSMGPFIQDEKAQKFLSLIHI